MPTTIDGNMAVSVGSVTVGSVTIDPGTNLIGKVQIQDDTTATLANVEGGAVQMFEKAANNIPIQTSVAVGAAPTLLAALNANRRSVVFTNKSINPLEIVYLGSATISVGNGIPLAPGETWEDNEIGIAWYGISASGTPSVAVLEADAI